MSVQCKGHKFRREDIVRLLPISYFHRETYGLRCMITVAGFNRYGRPEMQPAHKNPSNLENSESEGRFMRDDPPPKPRFFIWRGSYSVISSIFGELSVLNN